MEPCEMVCSLLLFVAMQPDPAAIRRLFEENLSRSEKQYGAEDVRTADAARDLGLFLKTQGDFAGARVSLARAVRIEGRLADVADLAALSPPEDAEPLWQRVAASPDPSLASRALAALGDLRAAA